jgi:hypothetical protein
MPLRIAVAFVLALIPAQAGPARAGTIDSPACRRHLTSASAGVSEMLARLKGVGKTRGEARCTAYRAQFLAMVKARAVFASCKTGSDRDAEVDRLDGTIEDLNGAIAESCAAQ